MNILRIDNGVPEKSSINQFRKDVGVMCRNEPPAETLAEHGYYYYSTVNPAYDTETQTLDPWEFQETAEGWIYTRPVRDMTVKEKRALYPVVSMRQARLALLGADLLDIVETAIQATDKAVQIEWEYATEVRRDSPLVVSLSQSLGLTEEMLDNLFSGASKQ